MWHTFFSLFSCRFIVEVYAWYGPIGSRNDLGELTTTSAIPPVQYIPYDEDVFRRASESTALEFLTFSVTLQEKPTPMTTTLATNPPATIPVTLLIGVIISLVVVVLVVLMVIALICVFGRRRNQPNKKR